MASPPFDLDQTNPLNSALVSTYPANERTFRENVEDWMNFEHGSASGRHKIPTGNDAARDAITDWEKGSLWMSSQASPTVLQMNTGTKASPVWLEVGQSAGKESFPQNTLMLFQQTAAPTFWTKETTHNNKALRLQTGTATTGGADSFTTVFGSGTHRSTDSHVLSEAEMPAHTHGAGSDGIFNGGDFVSVGAFAAHRADPNGQNMAVTGTSGSTGGGSGHVHTIDAIDLQFVDVIIAKMD